MSALFRKEIEPRCAWCAHSRPLDDDSVSCHKRGPMPVEAHCRSFRYDPLRRTPPRPAALRTNYSTADFALPEPTPAATDERSEEAASEQTETKEGAE